MFHGRDTSARAQRLLHYFDAATNEDAIRLPLSSLHYVETSRISNANRKARLGEALWHFSKGWTLLCYAAIVRHELEMALSKHFPQVQPREVCILGRGHAHAFCAPPLGGRLAQYAEEVERSILIGNSALGLEPPAFRGDAYRESFREHLASLHTRAQDVPKKIRENWLYAMSTADILGPLNEVAQQHALPSDALEVLGEQGLKQVLHDMPTRRVDLHLHRQVIKNPNYIAKPTDLEDWGGLAVASCYCDVVVCEKHMADMLRRDAFTTYARIETALDMVMEG
jgi:hypothetical protein